MANSVEVASTGQVIVTEVAEQTIEVVSPTAPLTVEVQTAGPQGPSGDAAGLPTGGDPGNILLKNTNANYDAIWSPVLDGGTFT
jgi:hypothetical protein